MKNLALIRTFCLGFMLYLWPSLSQGATESSFDYAKSSASDFVSYCRNDDNSKGCADTLQDIDTAAMINGISGNTPSCDWQDYKVSTIAATRRVSEWLEQHPEKGGATAFDGITSAISALWPCSGAPPRESDMDRMNQTSAGAFVTYCQSGANFKNCSDDILDIDTYDMVRGIHVGNSSNSGTLSAGSPSHVCVLGGGSQETAGDAQIRAVLQWLSQHPEDNAMRLPDAVRAAITALWPC